MKIAFRIAAAVVLLLLAFTFLPAIFTARHAWRTPKPFSGPKVCNPYDALASDTHWFRANFHAHSNVWEGKQPPCEVIAAYKKLGYDVAEVSDHGALSDTSACNDAFIPTYEHGANLRSVHFSAIGALRTIRDRHPVWVGLSQKQETIDRLKEVSEFVVVNHPCHNGAFSPSDFSKLEGYDAVDVQGLYCKSTEFWDSALSSGTPAWCFAGDDIHDIRKAGTGARYLYVDAPDTKREDVIRALRAGHFVCGFRKDDATDSDVPYPSALAVSNGTISLAIAKKATLVRWIGEEGKVLREDRDVSSATFPMETHPYVRLEIETASQRIWTQPVRRCE